MTEVHSFENWDDEAFACMVDLRNEIHKEIITSFPETLEDYAKFFGPTSIFKEDLRFRAFIVKREGQAIAKAILCWRPGSQIGNLGFIDWKNESSVARTLIQAVDDCAREKGLQVLKTPVDVNFFVKYRIRSEGEGAPFYGEPIYPGYYHDLFKETGFSVIGRWNTYQLKKLAGMKDFFKKRKRLASKKKDLRTTIRCVRLNDWDNELRIIHDLFTKSYINMPEYESVTFEQFKLIYDDFKYIIHPWFSYIVELNGKPVGFSINYVDPLSILAPLKGKKLNFLRKAYTLVRIRMNNHTYMIAHIGKIPGPNGEEIPGIQVQVSKKINRVVFFMRKIIVTFQKDDSPSNRAWNPDVRKPYSQYVLYGKTL